MSVLVGKKAPRFSTTAVVNGVEIVKDYSLEQFEGKNYVIFFFYPKDFTFVCPTELHAFQARLEEFEKRGCKVVACSTDTEQSHWGWLQMPKNQGGIQGITYPIVADTSKTISMNYGVLNGEYDYNENGEMVSSANMIAYRGLFLIDKNGIVRHQIVNDLPLGRSVNEALRTLDALIHVETFGEVCPADWQQGADAMTESHEGVADYLSVH